jgi:heme-degrading monooxygenase HmoA
MAFLIVHHKIEDYDKWKAVFDEHGISRKEYGSKGARVLQSVDDPNEVVAITEWDNIDQARAFGQSPGLRDAMQRAGVTSVPDVYFLDEVDKQSA